MVLRFYSRHGYGGEVKRIRIRYLKILVNYWQTLLRLALRVSLISKEQSEEAYAEISEYVRMGIIILTKSSSH